MCHMFLHKLFLVVNAKNICVILYLFIIYLIIQCFAAEENFIILMWKTVVVKTDWFVVFKTFLLMRIDAFLQFRQNLIYVSQLD